MQYRVIVGPILARKVKHKADQKHILINQNESQKKYVYDQTTGIPMNYIHNNKNDVQNIGPTISLENSNKSSNKYNKGYVKFDDNNIKSNVLTSGFKNNNNNSEYNNNS